MQIPLPPHHSLHLCYIITHTYVTLLQTLMLDCYTHLCYIVTHTHRKLQFIDQAKGLPMSPCSLEASLRISAPSTSLYSSIHSVHYCAYLKMYLCNTQCAHLNLYLCNVHCAQHNAMHNHISMCTQCTPVHQCTCTQNADLKEHLCKLAQQQDAIHCIPIPISPMVTRHAQFRDAKPTDQLTLQTCRCEIFRYLNTNIRLKLVLSMSELTLLCTSLLLYKT